MKTQKVEQNTEANVKEKDAKKVPKLPTLPDFDKLEKSTKNEPKYNFAGLKLPHFFYVINLKKLDILFKSENIDLAKKKLKYYSNAYQKENKTNKTPFIIVEYKNLEIISPEFEEDQRNQLLNNISQFEHKMDKMIGDVAYHFRSIFKRTGKDRIF